MFLKRLRTSFHFNFKLWKSVLDWTVVAYIAIPSIIIGFFLIRDVLINSSLIELTPTVFLSFFFLLSFFMSKSSLRLFLYDADLLFYKQQLNKIRTLKMTAYIYSFLFYNATLLTGLIFIAFFIDIPILKLAVVLNGLSTLHLIVNYLNLRWLIRFPLIIIIHLVMVLSFFYVPSWGYVILLIICQFLLLKMVLSNRYWTTEIKWESEAFYKWMKLLYQLSMEMRHYLPSKVQQPLLVVGKNKTFSKHRIDNLVYKSLLRKFQYISLPLRLIAICIGLLFILPTWAKAIVLGVTILGLITALNAILAEIKQAPFFQLITVSDEEWIYTKLRLQKRILYPIITFITILFFIL